MCPTLPDAPQPVRVCFAACGCPHQVTPGGAHLGVPNLAVVGGCISEPTPSALADQKHLFLSYTTLKALRAPVVEPCHLADALQFVLSMHMLSTIDAGLT